MISDAGCDPEPGATACARVLLVDASAGLRRAIRARIEGRGRVRIIAEAGSAAEAMQALERRRPDVICIDPDLPDTRGLDILDILAREYAIPVVVFAARSRSGSGLPDAVHARGAAAFLFKPRFGKAEEALLALEEALISSGAKERRVATGPGNSPEALAHRPGCRRQRTILLGASTGGVDALEAVLKGFPADAPPTLITQHMPAHFLASFTARLDMLVAPSVRLAHDGAIAQSGQVLIAPGGDSHMVLDAHDRNRVRLVKGPKQSGHRPSVDALFRSALPTARDVVAVLMTGMGHDGAAGMLELLRAGATTIAQDKASCVIYGMPRAAAEIGAVRQLVPLDQIAQAALRAARCGKAQAR